ncbi:hypothetical protein niasHT_003650 [Heterodera trifolii]|uniref:Effector protein n=1 Tax=Heterodera trifolii TaxID=157864 RepID=A0ABD2MEU5_9BILA
MYTICMAHFVFLAVVIVHFSEPASRQDRMISEMLDMEKGCAEETYCFCDFFHDGKGKLLMARGMCCGYDRLCRCCDTNPLFAGMPNITLKGHIYTEECKIEDKEDNYATERYTCARSVEPVPETACCEKNYIPKLSTRYFSGEARMFRESRQRSCDQPNEIIIALPSGPNSPQKTFEKSLNEYEALCIKDSAEFLVPRAKIGQITYAPIDSPTTPPATTPPSKAFRVTVPSYAAASFIRNN